MSLTMFNEDHYTPGSEYGSGDHVVNREKAETRYALVAVRPLREFVTSAPYGHAIDSWASSRPEDACARTTVGSYASDVCSPGGSAVSRGSA
jgi:hypothetical protein